MRYTPPIPWMLVSLLMVVLTCGVATAVEHPTTITAFQADGPAIQEGTFMGWQAITLHDGSLAATVVPPIGRLVAFGPLDGGNRLWLNPSLFPQPDEAPARTDEDGKPIWRNYGGFKIWPYPWTGWPPDSDLDGGAYQVSSGETWLLLESARSQRLDTAVSMRLSLRDQRLVLDLSMDSNEARAIWPVVQVPGSAQCLLAVPTHEHLSEVISSPQVAAADLDSSFSAVAGGPDGQQWLVSQHVAEHRKFDVTTAAGWIAAVDANRGNLRLSWDHPHPNPPDHGHDGSFYFNDSSEPAQQYLELECYSPVLAGSHTWVITLDLAEELSLP